MDQRQQFEQLALPFLPLLRRSAVQLTRDSQIAGDLIQDTYLKAWRCFDQFTPGTNCKAWLFSIMYSLFNSGYRKAQREWDAEQIAYLEQEYERWLDQSTAPLGSPADRWDRVGPEVSAALEQLPEDFRRAVVLVDIAELSYEEAALVMECAIGTVRSRLYRGRKLLFAALLPYARSEGYADQEKADD